MAADAGQPRGTVCRPFSAEVLRGEALKEEEARAGKNVERHHYLIEATSAILLALATIASAFCAYQSTRWHGSEADWFADSTALRIRSAQAYEKADREITVDAAFFSNYVYAHFEGDAALEEFFESNMFSPELQKAVTAWKATKPLENPDAPRTPFEMSEYRNSNLEKARALETQAREETDGARQAIRNADSYVLLTVLFASVLFFAGISTKFSGVRVKYALLAGGWVLFMGSLAALVFLPFPG